MKTKNIKNIAIIVICLLLTILIIVFMPDYSLGYGNVGKLYINEVMAKNTYTIQDEDGDFSDWIEIYNGYDKNINLEGYNLTDNELEPNKWTFPSVTIKKKSYLIIYASDKNRCSENVCHTNFKLSDNGEKMMLYNKKGDLLSKISFSKIDNDISYGLINKDYGYIETPTPGKENEGNLSNSSISKVNSDVSLQINEYITKNKRVNYDEDGDYSNWVELYNYGDKDINLEGFMLTDNKNEMGKYKFPKVTIKSKAYLVIYLSGKTKEYKNGSRLHTPFKLSSSDSNIVLADSKGNVIDKVDIVTLKDNISYGLKDKKWVYFSSPTPGKENTTAAFDMTKEGLLKKKIIINEVEATNSEWIELKNTSNDTIDIKGYKLKDKSGNSTTLPDVKIKSGSYYTVSNKIDINQSGEILYLLDNNNQTIDEFISGRLVSNVSTGIGKDNKKVYYKNTTKNSSNSKTEYSGYSDVPSFSIDGGYVDKNTKIYLTVDDSSTIYYTLDGSFPNNKSKKYTKDGINISKTTVVKAVSYKKNYIESEIISRTFIVGRKHDVAVVSISTNSNNFFGYGGIYSNYRLDKESKINFEFYEPDGSFGVEFTGGTKLVGQDSREFPQKSMAIYLRKQYGLQEVVYPFFEKHNVQTFSSFTLRNSGEDTGYMKIKDAFLTEVLNGQMDIDYQHYRPVVVYINGEYWGLYNIREKLNEDYLANNHEVNPDNVDLIKGNNDVKAGSMDNYDNLIKYMKTHDMTDKKVYEYVKTQIDVQELANYWIVETYYRNTDTGNIRFWKEKNKTGKWRWLLFDLDWAMYPTTYRSPSLNYITKPNGHGVGNWFSTQITYNLFKNKEFKDLYLKTFAYHLKNTFKPDRMNKILDQVASEVRSEMPYHIKRWTSIYKEEGVSNLTSMAEWESRINTMKEVVKNRYKIVLKNIKSEFNLSDKEYKSYFGGL